jgi:hypothetical protein
MRDKTCDLAKIVELRALGGLTIEDAACTERVTLDCQARLAHGEGVAQSRIRR